MYERDFQNHGRYRSPRPRRKFLGNQSILILLDTHAWLWTIGDPSHLTRTAKRRIEKNISSGGLAIADISLWEVAMLSQKRRLEIPEPFLPWLERALLESRATVHPITAEIAFQSTLFPEKLSDPA